MFPLVPESVSHLQRERSEPTAEVSQGRIVGYDSNRVIEHTTYDKNGILSHEGTGAADRPCQGDCLRQSRRGQPRPGVEGANYVSRVPESGCPLPLLADNRGDQVEVGRSSGTMLFRESGDCKHCGLCPSGRHAWSHRRRAPPATREWSRVGERRARRNQLILSARIAGLATY
jgi:hypothetical protein